MIINGVKLSNKKFKQIKSKVQKLKEPLQLDIIYIEKNYASETYIRNKERIGKELGFKVNIHTFPKNVEPRTLIATCNSLNQDPNCNGYLIQLPLKKRYLKTNILDNITPIKDVDCLSSTNLGKSMRKYSKAIYPATVEAIITILEDLPIHIKSKNVTIVNDSNLIGKPLTGYLLSRGATITICNEFTKNLKFFTKHADILVTATGKPGLIQSDMVKSDSVIIDAGISKKNNKIVGDVSFLEVKEKVRAITPVPGGVGPLTVICLFENLLKLYKLQK